MTQRSLDWSKQYYYVKPFIPRRLQILLRSMVATWKRTCNRQVWPIDRNAGATPPGWRGWPEGKQFALVLTHDVDTFKGHEQCYQLMQLEQTLGFRSSFNFVAASYRVSPELRLYLGGNGFEVGIHGLVHNRDLYKSREIFRENAVQINRYLETWGSVGFRSPCMYHNLDWIGDLDIAYDASTFDTDPFEPQPDGVGTIFPFHVAGEENRRGYVELPYTLPQDFTLFILLKEKNIRVWQEKLRWVAEQGGMALVNTHPDYMSFTGKPRFEEYPAAYYEELLQHVASEYRGKYWHALPRDVADFLEKSRRADEEGCSPNEQPRQPAEQYDFATV